MVVISKFSCWPAKILWVGMACFSASLMAALIGIPDLEELCKNSDLVGMGEVQPDLQTVIVKAVYKGDSHLVGSKITLKIGSNVDIDEGFQSLYDAGQAKLGVVFFLKKKVSLEFAFTNRGMCSFIAEKPPENSKHLPLKDFILEELFKNLSDPNPVVAESAFSWLKQLGTDEASKALKRAMTMEHPTLPVKIYQISTNLKNAKSSDVAQAVELLKQSDTKKISGELLVCLIDAFYKIESVDDTTTLNSLLSTENQGLAQALAFSARKWGDHSTVPVLVQRLNDFDAEYQFIVLTSLDFLTQRALPAHKEFKATPEKYIQDFLSWWKSSGKKLYIGETVNAR